MFKHTVALAGLSVVTLSANAVLNDNNYAWQLAFFLLTYAPISLFSRKLAIEKGRKEALWTFFGSLPVVNCLCLMYFVGAINRRLERKIDRLLREGK